MSSNSENKNEDFGKDGIVRNRGWKKYNKNHPHPSHINNPEKYTVLGKPRCQAIGKNGKQCSRSATLGKYCAVHADVQNKLYCKDWSKFSKVKEDVVKCLRNGYTMSTAGARCGVKARTITEWRNRGKLDILNGELDTPYAKFYEETEDARLYACSLVENALFSAAMNGNVSAMIRFLECRMPDVWNAKRALEINMTTTHQIQTSVQLDVSNATDDELRMNIQKIAEALCMTTNCTKSLQAQFKNPAQIQAPQAELPTTRRSVNESNC